MPPKNNDIESTKLTVLKELCARIDVAIRSADSNLSRVQFVEAVLSDAVEAIVNQKPLNPLRTVNQLRVAKNFQILQSELDMSLKEQVEKLAVEIAALTHDRHSGAHTSVPYPRKGNAKKPPKI